MSRQIYRQVGLIVALVVASVSLPVGIIGLTREPVITNNYYNTYNTYYNQTYYGGNETQPEHFTRPLEIINLYNIVSDQWFFERAFNLTAGNIIIIGANWTGAGAPTTYLVVDYFMGVFYDNPSAYSYSISTNEVAYWEIPFNATWHILKYSMGNTLGNMTIYLEIV